jgi:transcriptional regulator with XRE-family HTH domain
MTIGEKIRDLRTQRGLTQKDLAKAARTSFQTIYKYESNIITNIPLDKIELIAAALEVKPEEILGWSNDSDKNTDDLHEKLRRQPGLRIMFDAADGATEEQLMNFVKVIKALRDDNE